MINKGLFPSINNYVEREIDGVHYLHPIDESISSFINAFRSGFISKKLIEKFVTLEEFRSNRILELSSECQSAIFRGADISLKSEFVEHFEFKDKDQNNIRQMWDAVQNGVSQYPYQPDNGPSRLFLADDIYKIYRAMSWTITSNLTYYHQLKDHAMTLKEIDEIENLYWGQPLPEERQKKYDELMSVVELQLSNIKAKVFSEVYSVGIETS